eukprot:4971912-Pyramimonas_sp.AAC.3
MTVASKTPPKTRGKICRWQPNPPPLVTKSHHGQASAAPPTADLPLRLERRRRRRASKGPATTARDTVPRSRSERRCLGPSARGGSPISLSLSLSFSLSPPISLPEPPLIPRLLLPRTAAHKCGPPSGAEPPAAPQVWSMSPRMPTDRWQAVVPSGMWARGVGGNRRGGWDETDKGGCHGRGKGRLRRRRRRGRERERGLLIAMLQRESEREDSAICYMARG